MLTAHRPLAALDIAPLRLTAANRELGSQRPLEK